MSEISVRAQVGGKEFVVSTGKLAGQADGAVVAKLGGTEMLVTATADRKLREGVDFFPLTVDFEERMYSVGRIPGSFFRREGRPSDQAILTCRLIDRPLRPLFPDGYRHETHIVVTTLSVDHENPFDVVALNGASAALTVSPIPFQGPIGGVRLALKKGEWVSFATEEDLAESVFELVVAGRRNDDGEIDIGMVDTSMIYFAINHLDCAGGVMVTASHNPESYNGFKMVLEGAAAATRENALDAIEALVMSESALPRVPDFAARGRLSPQLARQPYIERLLEKVAGRTLSPMKIVCHAGNGCAGPAASGTYLAPSWCRMSSPATAALSEQIAWLFILPIAIACISWTVTHEEIFREAREYTASRSQSAPNLLIRKFFYVFTCEYCFSHYVTIAFLLFTGCRLLLDDWRGSVIAFFALTLSPIMRIVSGRGPMKTNPLCSTRSEKSAFSERKP